LIDGSFVDKSLQIGPSSSPENNLNVTISGARPIDLGLVSKKETTAYEVTTVRSYTDPVTGDRVELSREVSVQMQLPDQTSSEYLQTLDIEMIGFQNGDFSQVVQGSDGSLSIPGWEVFNSQLVLGRDSNSGVATLAGFSVPEDASPFPTNGSQTSAGDGNVPTRATFNTTVENGALRLVSNITTLQGGDVVRGPYVVSSESSFIPSGGSVSFNWRAVGGSDAYDVFAYLVEVDTGEVVVLLNDTGSTASDTGLRTTDVTVSSGGNYKFVFSSGTFDYSFGRAAGASLYIDNIEISDANGDPVRFTRPYEVVVSKEVSYREISVLTDKLIDIASRQSALSVVERVDVALNLVGSQRAVLGAVTNRLFHAIASNTDASIDLLESAGRIQDADYAEETANLARNQILNKASMALLAQANASLRDIIGLVGDGR
jgi:flagellin-like hook-associated protein FlgL